MRSVGRHLPSSRFGIRFLQVSRAQHSFRFNHSFREFIGEPLIGDSDWAAWLRFCLMVWSVRRLSLFCRCFLTFRFQHLLRRPRFIVTRIPRGVFKTIGVFRQPCLLGHLARAALPQRRCRRVLVAGMTIVALSFILVWLQDLVLLTHLVMSSSLLSC